MKYECIKNRSLRKYYEEENIELKPVELAWIIYHEERIREVVWETIEKTFTRNEETKEIFYELDYDKSLYEKFKVPEENYCYKVTIYDEDEEDIREGKLFWDFNTSYSYGMRKVANREDWNFEIEKTPILAEDKVDSEDEEFNERCRFDNLGRLRFFIIDRDNHSLEEYSFEKFIELPHPFRYGDILKYRYIDKYAICTTTDYKLYYEWIKEHSSGGDEGDTLLFVYPEGSYEYKCCYNHIAICNIERIEDIDDEIDIDRINTLIDEYNNDDGISNGKIKMDHLQA